MSRIVKLAGASGGGGATAAGLSTADVNTLIKGASPWAFIEQVDVTSNVAAVELTLSSDYSTFMILMDQAKGTNSSFFKTRYLTSAGSSGWISSGYGVNYHRGRSSSNGYNYQEGTSAIEYGSDTVDHAKTIELIFTTTKNNQRPVFRFHMGSGTSTYDPSYCIGGGQLNMNVNTEVTGMYIYPNSGNISSGSFKLYGLNNHA